jgi:hypothetical protein
MYPSGKGGLCGAADRAEAAFEYHVGQAGLAGLPSDGASNANAAGPFLAAAAEPRLVAASNASLPRDPKRGPRPVRRL